MGIAGGHVRSLYAQVFPENEVRKGQLTMQLKMLRKTQDVLTWAPDVDNLPVISWESCKWDRLFVSRAQG